tara:strand:- start:3890 stop:4234 length:345 start_codon:yes stop_codon:yes gene_type:complete
MKTQLDEALDFPQNKKVTVELLNKKEVWEHLFWTLQTQAPDDLVKMSFYNYVLTHPSIKKHNKKFEDSNQLSFPNANFKPNKSLKNFKDDTQEISFSTIFEIFPEFLQSKINKV